ESRASLKTWMYRILVNRAKTRGERDARTQPFSTLDANRADGGDGGDGEPTVDPGRFVDRGRRAGSWSAPPDAHAIPEEHVLVAEAGERLLEAVDHLPPTQRVVVTLRDVQGMTSSDVCELLAISE